jgi:hypothetical protein
MTVAMIRTTMSSISVNPERFISLEVPFRIRLDAMGYRPMNIE